MADLTRDRNSVLQVGLWSMLLCSIGMSLGDLPDGFSLAVVVLNRLLSLMAIGIALTLSLQWLSSRAHLHQNRDDLRRAQRQLKRLQTTLDMLSIQTDTGYWHFETQSRVFYWSDIVSRIVGQPAGQPVPPGGGMEFFPEPGYWQLREAFEQCVQTGKSYSEQLPMTSTSGQQRLVKTSGRPWYNERGEQIGVVGTLRDITGTTLSREQFVENAQALQQQLDALPVTVWRAQPDGSIDYFNQALSDYSGEPRETLSAPGEWLTLLHPDDQERCTRHWIRCVESGLPYQTQFRIRRYDGQYRWHQVQATPIRDLSGKITKWYGSAVEIPEATVKT
ncbi:PAS domain-containing protein [Marinimicrobium agarilyticum]|uniref:PAS domain-containing protein n=1 Tax=Marinimicrobium agarilyticum TaxID=306546 RepID=UPI00146ACB78|nr:PAS domain-containing protein [Marinimicrobium agarilyticum]